MHSYHHNIVKYVCCSEQSLRRLNGYAKCRYTPVYVFMQLHELTLEAQMLTLQDAAHTHKCSGQRIFTHTQGLCHYNKKHVYAAKDTIIKVLSFVSCNSRQKYIQIYKNIQDYRVQHV